MKHPNPLMLLRIAQGDAYCLATEYIEFPRDKATQEEALRFEKYGRHPTHHQTVGCYSDDTQMSCAVAEVLLSGRPFTREKFADAFVRCFKRDERKGYSRMFQEFLETVQSGEEFLAKINPNSDKNGAAMRAVPIGVLPTVEEVLQVAELQAKLTHDTPDGILSAQAVALMSHFALYEESGFLALNRYFKTYLPELGPISRRVWPNFPGGQVTGPRVGVKTVMAVAELLMSKETLMGILERTIQWGGDTDSVAAIAWGIASTRLAGDIPAFLEVDLEPGGKFGVAYLKELGSKLMSVV